MAATGFTPISLYYSATASAVPVNTNLANGELALNTADMKLYAKNSSGVVTLLASNGSTGATVSSVSGTGTVNGLTLTGTVTTSGSLTLGGTLSLVSPPPIGSTSPNTGAFTTLSATGNVSTASGFGYLWGAGAVQIYSNTSYLRFRTASTDRLEIDSSGNLGLGVTPSAWGGAYKVQQIGAQGIEFYSSGTFGIGNNFYNSGSGNVRIAADYVTLYQQTVGQHQWLTAGTSTAGSAVSFTQAMTLDASGNLLVGATSASGKLTVQDSGNSYIVLQSSTGGYANIRCIVTSAAGIIGTEGAFPFVFRTSDAERARISSAGGFSVGTTADPGAGAIYATGNITAYYSDARLKTVSGKIENALDKVAKLSGVYYTNNSVAKSFGYDSDEVQVGVLAQEVEAVLPQIVKAAPFDLDENNNSKSGENYKTVQYERLVPLLIEAINELQTKVKVLEAK